MSRYVKCQLSQALNEKLNQEMGLADINECEETLNICGNGECENMLGSYHCRCEEGYAMHPDKKGCNDIDECDLGTNQCDTNVSTIETQPKTLIQLYD